MYKLLIFLILLSKYYQKHHIKIISPDVLALKPLNLSDNHHFTYPKTTKVNLWLTLHTLWNLISQFIVN